MAKLRRRIYCSESKCCNESIV